MVSRTCVGLDAQQDYPELLGAVRKHFMEIKEERSVATVGGKFRHTRDYTGMNQWLGEILMQTSWQ